MEPQHKEALWLMAGSEYLLSAGNLVFPKIRTHLHSLKVIFPIMSIRIDAYWCICLFEPVL